MKTVVNIEMTVEEYTLIKNVIKTSHFKTSKSLSGFIERIGFCERTEQQERMISSMRKELEVLEQAMKLIK